MHFEHHINFINLKHSLKFLFHFAASFNYLWVQFALVLMLMRKREISMCQNIKTVVIYYNYTVIISLTISFVSGWSWRKFKGCCPFLDGKALSCSQILLFSKTWTKKLKFYSVNRIQTLIAKSENFLADRFFLCQYIQTRVLSKMVVIVLMHACT